MDCTCFNMFCEAAAYCYWYLSVYTVRNLIFWKNMPLWHLYTAPVSMYIVNGIIQVTLRKCPSAEPLWPILGALRNVHFSIVFQWMCIQLYYICSFGILFCSIIHCSSLHFLCSIFAQVTWAWMCWNVPNDLGWLHLFRCGTSLLEIWLFEIKSHFQLCVIFSNPP